jgi:tetratricopeptide (TPR) repeat protein
MNAGPIAVRNQNVTECRQRFRTRWISICTLAAALTCLLAVLGCDDPEETSGPAQGQIAAGDQRGQLFETFARNLNQLEDFPPQQMLPTLRDYLNQWQRQVQIEFAWSLDPVVKSLPEKFRTLPEVARIEAEEYDTGDMEFLAECVWLRDIAKQARGEGYGELKTAANLFDWTIRNLQIEPDDAEKGTVANQNLSEILLVGRATAIERAWVFIQLCRQLGIDAVMLAIPDRDDSSKATPWLPAVRVQDELYLFDTRLGLPIPGPDGRQVATLAEVAANDQLLRALDLDAEHPYPVKSADVQKVVALVEGSPGYLSRGMKQIESHLVGNERVVLSTHPTRWIESLKKLPHIADARLWLMPYEVLAARRARSPEEQRDAFREMLVFMGNTPLYGGRVRMFKGLYDGERGAKRHFIDSRPAEADLDQAKLTPQQRAVVKEAKQAASFWLGLIAFDQKDYTPAIDYFYERVLLADPDGVWTAGARYNLGRSYEILGETEKAVAQYQLDKSPQSHGNRLRARRLLQSKKKS